MNCAEHLHAPKLCVCSISSSSFALMEEWISILDIQSFMTGFENIFAGFFHGNASEVCIGTIRIYSCVSLNELYPMQLLRSAATAAYPCSRRSRGRVVPVL